MNIGAITREVELLPATAESAEDEDQLAVERDEALVPR